LDHCKGATKEGAVVGFSSIRHIPVYLESDMTTPIAACSMTKARILINEHSARLGAINGRSGLPIGSADILNAHIGPFLQLISPSGVGSSKAPIADAPVPSHRPMNDRQVMELLVEAANLTRHVQGALDERTIAELREIRQRLSDAVPGMTFPRPTIGPVASKLNQMLLIFSQAQTDKKLDDVEIIRKIQAFTW
jgi:hypothetical protein